MPPRPTWLDKRVGVFLEELSQFGLVVSHEHAAGLIRDRVSAVASDIGVTEQTARRYLSEDIVRQVAREVAVTLADEQPGADVLEEPRTVSVTLPRIGRTLAALAEAAHVRVLNTDDIGAHGAMQVISMIGQVLSQATAALTGSVMLPQAGLARGARLLEATAEMVRDGAVVPDVPSGDVRALARAFASDAAALRALLAEHGTRGGPTPAS